MLLATDAAFSQGKQGTDELGANTVLKQTNELCFQTEKLPSLTVIGQSKWLGSFGLAQQVLIQIQHM